MSDGRKMLVVDAEAAAEIRALAPHDTWATPVPNAARWKTALRALTPVSEGGEAVPFEEGAEVDGLYVEFALASQTAERRQDDIRAAFADPRAVEAGIDALIACPSFGGDSEEVDRSWIVAILAAACEAVLAKETK